MLDSISQLSISYISFLNTLIPVQRLSWNSNADQSYKVTYGWSYALFSFSRSTQSFLNFVNIKHILFIKNNINLQDDDDNDDDDDNNNNNKPTIKYRKQIVPQHCRYYEYCMYDQ